jgi:hypothetical protein
MKKYLCMILLLVISANLYPIKFTIDSKTENKIILQTIFGLGFSMDAVSDIFGTTEYQVFFVNTAFHVNDFGIGLNLKFRFKFYNDKTYFFDRDWYEKDDPLKTFFSYMDKIEYIKYGDSDFPVYFTTGKIPITTFGTGFVFNDFHNHTFLPVSRENGFYFKYNGQNLDKYKLNKNPFEFTFLIPDLLDPDIYAANFSLDILKLTPYKDFNLITGISTILDFNATEKNRVSTLDQNVLDKGNYRNIASGFTTSIMMFSLPAKFIWTNNNYYMLTAFQEISFLFDPPNINNNGFRFGWGYNIGAEMRFLKLKDSVFLIGITNSLMIQSSNFIINYFSSNYDIIRLKQYLNLQDNYSVYIMTGISLYALNDNFQFHANITIPLNTYVFTAKISSKIVLERLLFPTTSKLPDLYIGIFFETGINQYRITAEGTQDTVFAQGNNGEYFLDSLTQDFRFSFELGFKYYGTKIGVLLGFQRPESIDIYDGTSKRILSSKYASFGDDIEKFISLEVSFVL